MAWEGFFQYGGTEIINASRTEAYASHLNAGWFKPIYNQSDLAWLLDDPSYATPLQDDAPWTDPDNLDSYDFLGVYPLDITGIEDSTVVATVTESVIDGGYIGRTRKGTRAIVFNAVLVGLSSCAVEYGLRWLRNVLNGSPCFGSSYGVCGGAELCYIACAPPISDCCETSAEDCYDKVGRSLHQVTVTVGPNVTKKMDLIDGSAAWTVTWTMVAANPAEFGVERPLVVGFLDPAVDIPYYGGVVPDGGAYDENGFVQTETKCPAPVFTPVFDPTCALLVAPPDVPTIVPMCFSFPVNYTRRSFTIPRELIPLWTEVVPVLQVTTKADEARNVRIRFYADTFNTGNPSNDPCNYCGDLVISYVPPSATLVLNGMDQSVYIDQPGQGRRRADALVTDSTGNPFDWPQFSCGFGYVVTVDLPQQTKKLPVVDLSLVPRII